MRAWTAQSAGPDEDVRFGLDYGERVGAVAVSHGRCSCRGYCSILGQSELCRVGETQGIDLRGRCSLEEADVGCWWWLDAVMSWCETKYWLCTVATGLLSSTKYFGRLGTYSTKQITVQWRLLEAAGNLCKDWRNEVGRVFRCS